MTALPTVPSYRSDDEVTVANADLSAWLMHEAARVRRGDYEGVVVGSLLLVTDTGRTALRSYHDMAPQ